MIQFIAALAISHLDDLKKGMNSSYSSYRPGPNNPILQIVLVQNSYSSKEMKQFWPPNSSDDLYLIFCLYHSSMLAANENAYISAGKIYNCCRVTNNLCALVQPPIPHASNRIYCIYMWNDTLKNTIYFQHFARDNFLTSR